jgi:hypothetical protein
MALSVPSFCYNLRDQARASTPEDDPACTFYPFTESEFVRWAVISPFPAFHQVRADYQVDPPRLGNYTQCFT